jgi:hypothetical protein
MRCSHAAPRQAREFVRAILDRWQLGAVADVACLLASELVTNVVRHVGNPMSLRVELLTGRGLMLLDALAHTWGPRQGRGEKVVWFSLPALPACSM